MEDAEGNRFCVRCDREDSGASKYSKEEPEKPEEKHQKKPQSEGKDKKLPSRNEVSQLVSQKLLAGWTLLQTLCPGPDCVGVCQESSVW